MRPHKLASMSVTFGLAVAALSQAGILALGGAGCSRSSSGNGSGSGGGNGSGVDSNGGLVGTLPASPPAGDGDKVTSPDVVAGAPAMCTPGDAAQLVVVTTAKGPKGAAAPVPITNGLTSVNVYDQDRVYDNGSITGKLPVSDRFVAFLKAIDPGFLRFPAGVHAQKYTFMPNGPEGGYNLTPALLASYMDLVKRTGAKPYITVNANADPKQIADLVRFVNITQKYGVTWWEIGNEPDVDGWTDDPAELATAQRFNPTKYGNAFNTLAAAMRGVDPAIKIVGGVLLSGQDIVDLRYYNADGSTKPGGDPGYEKNWATPIMNIVKDGMDGFAWHYYPMYASTNATCDQAACYCTPERIGCTSTGFLLQEDGKDWPPAGLNYADSIMPYLRQFLAKYKQGMSVWIDEFAEDPGPDAAKWLGDKNVGGLWAADALGRFANHGTEVICKFIFKASGKHYYTLLDNDAGESLHPAYYSYWLYAQHFGDKMVDVQANHPADVIAHAALRSDDGSLRVMIINKSTKAQSVRVTLPDYKPTKAGQFSLLFLPDQDGQSAFTGAKVTLNGATLTDANIGKGAAAISAMRAEACADNVVQVAPTSVTLLVFDT